MIVNPCVPSPCGSYAQCRNINGAPACSCLDNYIGQPPNCRPECSINSECTSDRACINLKCVDPCPGSCGTFAICSVHNHVPACTCPQGYIGDPFTQCRLQPPRKQTHFFLPTETDLTNQMKMTHTHTTLNFPELDPVVLDKCNPSPCGANALCRDGECTCPPEFQKGDPYTGCRPECVQNPDCPRDRACMQRKCQDPCPGACAQNAICTVINHVPMCSCPTGLTGNAFSQCTPIPRNYRFSFSYQVL